MMSRCLFYLTVIVVSCLFTHIPIWAAEDETSETTKLDELLITASSETRLMDEPGSISVITAQELKELRINTIAEALIRIPGVNDNSFGREGVTVRGATSSMAGSALIMVDGVRHKLGAYERDSFSFLPISQIERIEVIKSGGLMAGLGAGRGVINIITKRPDAETTAAGRISASYGSWNTHQERINLYGKSNKWDYMLDLAYYGTDGFEDDEEEKPSFMAKISYWAAENTRFGFVTNYVKHDMISAYNLKKTDWHINNGYATSLHFPKSATDNDLIWHTEREREFRRNGLEFEHRTNNWFAKGMFAITEFDQQYYKDAYKFDRPTSVYHDDFDQTAYDAEFDVGYTLQKNTFTYSPSLSINYNRKSFDSDRVYPYNPGKNTDGYVMDIDQEFAGLFWDNRMIWDALQIDASLRLDHAETDFSDRAGTEVKEDGNYLGYSIAPSYFFAGKNRIYAQMSKTFWYPTPKYFAWAAEKTAEALADGLNKPDANLPQDLDVEENLTFEIGYRMAVNSIMLDVNTFYTETGDKYMSLYVEEDSGKEDWRGVKNIGDATSIGVEAEMQASLTNWLGFRLNASYLETEWDSIDSASTAVVGKQFVGVPSTTALVGIDVKPTKHLTFNIDINYEGSYYIDEENTSDYRPDATVDLRATYKWQGCRLWAKAKNVFDEENYRVGESRGSNYYYPQDGRYLEVGAEYRF